MIILKTWLDTPANYNSSSSSSSSFFFLLKNTLKNLLTKVVSYFLRYEAHLCDSQLPTYYKGKDTKEARAKLCKKTGPLFD